MKKIPIYVFIIAALIFITLLFFLLTQQRQATSPRSDFSVAEHKAQEKVAVESSISQPVLENTPAQKSEVLPPEPTPKPEIDSTGQIKKLTDEVQTALVNKDYNKLNNLLKELVSYGASAIPIIEKLLNDSTTSIELKLQLIKALGGIGGEEAINLLLEQLSKGENALYTFACTMSLRRAVGDKAEELLQRELSKANNYEVLTALLKVMGEVTSPETINQLQELIKNNAVPLETKIAAARYLGKDGLEFLNRLLMETQEEYADEIFSAMINMENPEALGNLLSLAQNNALSPKLKSQLNAAISELFEELNDNEQVSADLRQSVQKYLLEELKTAVRVNLQNITNTLALIDSDEVRETLLSDYNRRLEPIEKLYLASALIDNYNEFRDALPPHLSQKIFSDLTIYTLPDYSVEVRRTAMMLLAQIGGDEARIILRGLLDDNDPSIRSLAKRLIQE